MIKNDSRRRQMFCDREVQGALMLRVVGYWCFCLLTIMLMLLCWSVLTEPPRRIGAFIAEFYHRYAPALAASLIVLPIVMIDVVRLSNRFVGPIKRLRDGMTALADGEDVRHMQFRDRDFWINLADLFNVIAAKSKPPVLRKHASLLGSPIIPPVTPAAVELERPARSVESALHFDDIVVRP